jgi:3'-phosphoadenosine 5'-phosphosulfate sulfotransferase (PAPS reductase)/FAD synthetase
VKHVVCFSGGKDSTALLLWAKENLGEPGVDWTAVFCDTGWEHPLTYAYVDYIDETVLNRTLMRLKSEKYPDGFVQLVIERKMIPGVHSRFCTQELKVFPLHRYFEALDDEVTSYQGVRADESLSRSKMAEEEWLDDAGGYWIRRPLLRWTAAQCFEIMAKHDVKPNPLYMMGSTRVGCWPCIMTGLGELKRALQFFPELKERLIEMERKANEAANDPENYRTWFRADKIPARFCSKSVTTKDGRQVPIPTCEDVFRYIESADDNQLALFPSRSCMSVYNLCE